MNAVLVQLRETFGLDLRGLGILRILLGIMLLIDYGIRAEALEAHYTDLGVLPVLVNQIMHLDPAPGRFSFHAASGELPLQVVLFAAAAVFAIALTLGYFTKVSLLASLILLLSVQNRNWEIATGGDYLLRVVCFWGLFLPLGARFSLDARAGRFQPDPRSRNLSGNQYFSLATAGLLAQMAVVYFFSALHKGHPIWRVEHTAIHYALHIDSYDTWLGSQIREFPWLTNLLTRATLGFEFFAPVALFLAGVVGIFFRRDKSLAESQSPLRSAVTLAFILFHLGLASTLSLGTFAWFAALIWVGLFPTWAWDLLAKHPRISKLPLLRKLQEKPPKITPRLKLPLARAWSSVMDAVAAVALFYVFLWNAYTVKPSEFRGWLSGEAAAFLPDARPAMNFTGLEQHWGLFAPYPRTSDGYFVALGRLKNRSEIDYLSPDHKVTWKKPDDVSGSFATFRWRKYFRAIRFKSKKPLLGLYLEHVCRDWNKTHAGDQKLEAVTLYFMRRITKRSGGYKPTRKERLASISCGAPSTMRFLRQKPPPRAK